MAKAATLNIDIVAKAEQALGEFDKVKAKATEGHNAMKVAAVAASAAIFAGLGEATKAAAEHEAGIAKLEQAYKNAGISGADMKDSIEGIEAASRRTGQSTEDSIAAYTDLVTATRSSEQAHRELAIAQDLAAFKGIGVREAADAITRAAGGNTRALKEMGIATKDAGGHQLTTAALMDSLSKAVAGQADAFGKTSAGAMARYHESLDQTKVAIGEALLPALAAVLAMLRPLFDWFTRNTAVLHVLAPIVAVLAGAIMAITVAMRIWTAVQWALNVAMNANPIGLVVLAIAALVAGVIYAYSHFQTFRNIVADVWGAIRTFGEWVLAHWTLIVGALLGPIGFLILNFHTVISLLETILDHLGAVGRAVSDAMGWLGKLPKDGGSLLGKLNPFSLPPGGGLAPAPVVIQIVATPGDDLPETVYRALREYQRRHARSELVPMFGAG